MVVTTAPCRLQIMPHNLLVHLAALLLVHDIDEDDRGVRGGEF